MTSLPSRYFHGALKNGCPVNRLDERPVGRVPLLRNGVRLIRMRNWDLCEEEVVGHRHGRWRGTPRSNGYGRYAVGDESVERGCWARSPKGEIVRRPRLDRGGRVRDAAAFFR